jgi:DNA polymerase III psi subunit
MGIPSLQMSKAGRAFLRSEISSNPARKASVWQQMFQQERLRPAK